MVSRNKSVGKGVGGVKNPLEVDILQKR